MAETGYLADRRRRTLAILAGLAVVSAGLAFLGVHEETAQLAPKYEPETFLPGIASRIGGATRIHVAGKNVSFDVVKSKSGWVLPARGGYPASFDEVQKTLVSLAGLETVAPKTARPDWFHYVGLDVPPKGSGVLISVGDAQGTIAAVIFGKPEDIGDASGALGLFARKANENQSWLVRSVFQPKASVSDWIDKNVLSVDRARIAETDVTPIAGAAYIVKRDKPSDADFALASIPKGRSLSDPAAADPVAAAIADFAFDDVRPASAVDFSKAAHLVTKTFDGLTVSTDAVAQGSDTWVRLSAAAAPGSAVASEANEINARSKGWAYKLPSYKGQPFMTSLESLLKPTGAPASATQ